MKLSEFKKLIREEVRKILQEAPANSRDYGLMTGYPKETLQALSKHMDVKNIKPRAAVRFTAGGAMRNKKMYFLDFTADKGFVQVLGKYPNLKAPFDKLLQFYNVDKPTASKRFANSEASEIEDYFSAYNVTLTSSFNLQKFAKEADLTVEQAKIALVNLEDDTVMKSIAKGTYTAFDIFDPSIFNDEYDQMMDDLGLQPG